MALTYLLRCSACDREIRGFDSRLGQKLQPGTMLTEGGVLPDRRWDGGVPVLRNPGSRCPRAHRASD